MIFTLDAKEITVVPSGRYSVELTFEADISAVLDNLSSREIAYSFDNDSLLEAIGVERAKEYFGLVEEE